MRNNYFYTNLKMLKKEIEKTKDKINDKCDIDKIFENANVISSNFHEIEYEFNTFIRISCDFCQFTNKKEIDDMINEYNKSIRNEFDIIEKELKELIKIILPIRKERGKRIEI